MDFMRKLEWPSYVALRFFSGLLLLFHGLQKLFGVFTDKPVVKAFTQAWVGGCLELLCGALVAVGLLTRPAAFLASGMMAVAYFQFHVKMDFSNWHFLPINNGGELAVLYCFIFLCIAAHGPGKWSLDRK